MVFSPEHNAFILMAHFRSGTLIDGAWSYDLQSCINQFQEQFPNFPFEYDNFKLHKSRIVQRFENNHCICKGKSSGAPKKLTDDAVQDIRNRMEQSPTKSVNKLSAQTGLAVGTCHKALTKNLHMHAYKVSVVQELLPPDYERRIRYCEWFETHLNNNELLDLTFFSDEAWFHLSGYVNSQNYRTWSSENPHTIVETSLHPQKIGVWVAMSRRRIIGPIFFHETINSERYESLILEPFIDSLHDDELHRGYFQQDGATAHTSRRTMQFLRQFYDNRLISQGLWPPRSPDLTPLDFYLFGRLKNNVFRNRIHNLEELEEVITEQINLITQNELQRVFENMKRRVNLCHVNEGHHFQHLI